jgi:hypothetical protein
MVPSPLGDWEWGWNEKTRCFLGQRVSIVTLVSSPEVSSSYLTLFEISVTFEFA